jgi:hypothetical protein
MAVIPLVDAFLMGLPVVLGKGIHIQRDMAQPQGRYRGFDGLNKLNDGLNQYGRQRLSILINSLWQLRRWL